MELLSFCDVSLFREGRSVLSAVSFTLNSGQKLGLIGANGAGKSTLLRIAAGRLSPDEGRVRRAPGLRFGYVGPASADFGPGTVQDALRRSQHHLLQLEDSLRHEERRLAAGEDRLEAYGELMQQFEMAGGYRADAHLEEALAALRLGPELRHRPLAALSGGERARLRLVVALAKGPELLLLDEPSNHLDIGMRRWLAATLAAYPGGVLMASHDRALLDAVSTHTAELSAGALDVRKGNYSTFRQRALLGRHAQEKAETERRKTLRRLRESRARAGVRQRKVVDARIARLESELEPPDPQATPRRLALHGHKARGTLLQASGLRKAVAGKQLLDDVSLRIGAGDRISLLGPNGTGKSTLLAILAGLQESDDPTASMNWEPGIKLAVFDQHGRGLTEDMPLLAQLERYVSAPRARMLLALVGLSSTMWDREPDALSTGERARAGLALLMATEATLLLLDEPSEGLDLTGTLQLEEALRDTPAAFILVTHDQSLAESVAERIWALENGRLVEFRGGLEGYWSGNSRLVIGPDETPAEVDAPAARQENPAARLERLELEQMALDERLEDPFLLSGRERQRIGRRYRELLDERSQLYDANLPPALPPYGIRHGPVETWAEPAGSHTFQFSSNTGLSARMLVVGPERIGHLVLQEPADACLLSWARRRALAAIARLAFERLEVRTLQAQSAHDLESAGFQDAGACWWLLSRRSYELQEGYLRTRPHRRSKRLVFHPDWNDWVAYRRWRKGRR